jgi:hypothetical protein
MKESEVELKHRLDGVDIRDYLAALHVSPGPRARFADRRVDRQLRLAAEAAGAATHPHRPFRAPPARYASA